jgi:hypothetical protein
MMTIFTIYKRAEKLQVACSRLGNSWRKVKVSRLRKDVGYICSARFLSDASYQEIFQMTRSWSSEDGSRKMVLGRWFSEDGSRMR